MPQDRKYNMFQDSKRGKDCRSPGRLSDIQPVEMIKFPSECYNFTLHKEIPGVEEVLLGCLWESPP